MGLYPYLKSEERIFYANGVGSFLTLKISHGNVCYCCCIGIEGKMSSEREKNWINFFMSSYYKAARYSKKGSILVKGKRKLLSFEWHQCKKRALIKFIIVGEFQCTDTNFVFMTTHTSSYTIKFIESLSTSRTHMIIYYTQKFRTLTSKWKLWMTENVSNIPLPNGQSG